MKKKKIPHVLDQGDPECGEHDARVRLPSFWSQGNYVEKYQQSIREYQQRLKTHTAHIL